MSESNPTVDRNRASDRSSALLTFLLADVRGYTRYSAEHGDHAAAHLSELFLSICREIVSAHDGEVFGSAGDQALAAFASAHAAIHAALALQARLAEEQAAHRDLPLQAGIGLDTGEGIRVGNDYRGNAINLAARLCSLAGGGEIFASETVIQVARKVDGLAVVDRGEVTLKGLPAPIRIVQIAPEGALPTELPPLQPILVTHPTNLPDEPTPFIGRSREITAVAALLQRPQVRMVTLTGPGGTGKTRLALQVGNTLLHNFRDGVFFVDLSPLTDPALVPATIADVLSVAEQPGRDRVETLTEALQAKHLLLVLDNFEHLLDSSRVVAVLLDRCRELHVLVTSRIPLHLSREHEHSVPPLSVPDPAHLPAPDALSQYESVALFIERARAARDTFAVTNENAPAVAEICARLDGLPLAIELAAARTKVFPPQALLQRLSGRLAILTGGAQDRPTRQQTLRNTIDWSHSLLTEGEQIVFARLSVFAGGCTFEAAEAVCNPGNEINFLDALTSLVDKSLVRQEGHDAPRLSLLETIREYATEKLADRGELDECARRHADTYIALAEEAGAGFRAGGDPVPWLNVFLNEHDNLRASISWSLRVRDQERALRLTGATWIFWQARNMYDEGLRRLEAALALPGASPAIYRAMALRGASALAGVQGDTEQAVHLGEQSLALYREAGDDAGVAFQAMNMAILLQNADDVIRALPYLEESEAMARQMNDAGLIAAALSMRSFAMYSQGKEDEGMRLVAEAVAIQRQAGITWNLANNLGLLSVQHRERGEYEQAEQCLEEAFAVGEPLGNLVDLSTLHGFRCTLLIYQGKLDQAREVYRTSLSLALQAGGVPAIVNALGNALLLAATEGKYDLAARLYGAEEIGYERIGITIPSEILRIEEPYITLAREQLGDVAWEAAVQEGRKLSPQEAADLSLTSGA